MLCSKCGAELREDAQLCSKCGGAVAEIPAVIQVPSDITSEATLLLSKKSAWKAWLLVGIILLILGGGGAIGWQMQAKKAPVGQAKKNPTDNAPLVWIPGATFTMGSAAGVGNKDEQPAHQVTLSGFWIYKYDVTVAQYRAFCAATTYALPKFPEIGKSWKGKTGWDDPALQQHPIVNVTWNDAKAYADWAGVILPTEAQWEYAARGPRGNNYPWGGTATKDDLANGWDATKCANWENSGKVEKSTWPVGSFPAGASWCGAQDMAGNVWQWCSDWYGDYSTTPVTNPAGPATGKSRVLRGGSWYGDGNVSGSYGLNGYRSADRYYNDLYRYPVYYGYGIGFRCCSLSPGP